MADNEEKPQQIEQTTEEKLKITLFELLIEDLKDVIAHRRTIESQRETMLTEERERHNAWRAQCAENNTLNDTRHIEWQQHREEWAIAVKEERQRMDAIINLLNIVIHFLGQQNSTKPTQSPPPEGTRVCFPKGEKTDPE